MKLSLNTQILIGAIAGILLGIGLNIAGLQSPFYGPTLYISGILGSIFVNLLKMVLIPLVFTSIAVGIVSLRAHAQMHNVWKYTMIYFLATPTIAVTLGLLCMNFFKPGRGLDIHLFEASLGTFDAQKMTLAEFVKRFIGELFVNPITAMATVNVMAVVVFALLIGIALIRLGDRANTVVKILEELFEVMMLMVDWIMRIAPIGIMALLIKLVAAQDVSLFTALGKFIAIVLGSTLFHGIVVLPGLLYLLTGVTPLMLFKGIREAMITAFSTSSSSATMPITLRCVEQNLKVDRSIAGFVVPLGTTVNMDGTALYEAMAALFIANLVGIDLHLGQQIIVALMAILASIGAPGIPSAGMVTMIMVLQSVGLPIEAIAILLPIDRPLDAVRTMVNVEGDAVGSLIVQKFSYR
ncbi:MAG: dicarboxylate/amino acid:cation symporter [Candidatus Omnitrophota bacterium]|nr:dicarboxylate/amino acid:cation symporter [Candidatus Omnitrophota bacterium]